MKNKNQNAILDKLNKVADLGALRKNPVKAISAAKNLTKDLSKTIAANKEAKVSMETPETEEEEVKKPETVVIEKAPAEKSKKKSKGLYAKAAATLMFWSKFFFILFSVTAVAFAVYSYVLNQTTEGLIFSVVIALAVPFASFIVFLLPSAIGQLTAVSEKLCEILAEKEFTIRTQIETVAAQAVHESVNAGPAPVKAQTKQASVKEEPADVSEEEDEVKPAEEHGVRNTVIPTAVVIEDEEDGKPERIIRKSASNAEERPKRKVIEPVVDQDDIDDAFGDKEEEPKSQRPVAAKKEERRPYSEDSRPYHDDPLEDIPEGQVKVLSPNGAINFYQENMTMSNPKSCIISDADPDFYHTNLNCWHTWPAKKRDAFTFWRISTRRVAEHYSMAYCPNCFKNDADQI